MKRTSNHLILHMSLPQFSTVSGAQPRPLPNERLITPPPPRYPPIPQNPFQACPSSPSTSGNAFRNVPRRRISFHLRRHTSAQPVQPRVHSSQERILECRGNGKPCEIRRDEERRSLYSLRVLDLQDPGLEVGAAGAFFAFQGENDAPLCPRVRTELWGKTLLPACLHLETQGQSAFIESLENKAIYRPFLLSMSASAFSTQKSRNSSNSSTESSCTCLSSNISHILDDQNWYVVHLSRR